MIRDERHSFLAVCDVFAYVCCFALCHVLCACACIHMRMCGGRRVQVSFPSANVGEHKVKLEKRGTLPTEAHGTVRGYREHRPQAQRETGLPSAAEFPERIE
jgi:hypothetical protein